MNGNQAGGLVIVYSSTVYHNGTIPSINREGFTLQTAMPIACCFMPDIALYAERARSPHLAGRPVGIAGPDDILVVVSEEAAPFGIRIGQTSSGARGLCERLTVLPYDRPAYELAV